MPYIKSERRNVVGVEAGRLQEHAQDPGELNFQLTELIYAYFVNRGGRYQQVNDVLGALEGAKLEFYRRVAAPYEDKKIIENGDVYV